ncbi:hypothetical protein PACID_34200 [Acidipropionibacterium acidipropionici ATCC 4875]|uniref:Uncharacterized protein n=1 Tax=Acidipropionibacterium acidipropionici (strain ATCC 4875 / DSM 20272 / JCM 6432 / NBRC 12425 / NCIMB 8070 / 4) TaxID=1171373 RepID=K7RXI3_ACIA4|nr:hypothetical protein PACID_34200 [Acidipropionibacterium acidipropionici ATCC 4875]
MLGFVGSHVGPLAVLAEAGGGGGEVLRTGADRLTSRGGPGSLESARSGGLEGRGVGCGLAESVRDTHPAYCAPRPAVFIGAQRWFCGKSHIMVAPGRRHRPLARRHRRPRDRRGIRWERASGGASG